jgi:O-antigen/teichoic acid export membrane protein
MSETVHSSLKTAVRGTSLVFLGMVSSVLLWFLTKILIIRYTTKEEFGLYSLLVAIVGIFSVISTLGLQEGVARYIAVFSGEGKRNEAKGIAGDAIVIAFLSSLCVFSLLLFFSGILSKYIFYKPELQPPLKIISFLIPFSVMVSVMNGMLRGHNIFNLKVYVDVGQPLFFLVFLGIFFLVGFSFISIIYAYVLSMVMVFFIAGFYTLKKVELSLFSLRFWGRKKELLGFSIPVLAVSMLGVVLGWTDTLMLGRYTKAESVGIYNVSISLAKLLTFPLSAISFVLMPIAGEMYGRNQSAELGRIYQVLTKWIFSATFPIFFILFFFPEMTISFLFGERFTDASVPLRILAVCFLFNSFMGANGLLLLVMGLSKTLMKVSMFGVALNIGLNYLLIKRLGYGIIGAAISTLISYIALNLLISWILYRRSRIHPLTWKYIKPIVSSSVIGLFIYALVKSLPLYLWMLPVYLLLFLCGYLLSILLTKSIDEEDIYIFETILGKLGVPQSATDSLLKFISRAR